MSASAPGGAVQDARWATGPVAVVMSRFPVVTETFILRELDELERVGVPVVLVPLLREEPETVHPQAVPWVGRAQYAPLLDWRLARDVARELASRPLRTTALLLACAWDARSSLNALAGVLAYFPKSVSLGRRLRARGVRHVHAHFATHPALAAMVMSRAGGAEPLPFSITVHAHDIFLTQAGLRRKIAACSFARCISAFNVRFLQERLGADVAPASKLPVIHCGIEPDLYASRPAKGRPGADRPLRLLCVAALKEYKGVGHLVDAVALARDGGLDVACRIIGGGPLRAELDERVRSRQLQDRVQLLGPRTQEEVARELASSDAFVLPSVVARDGQMEGLPVALMEALAAGVPVVATRLSGIPELVRPGETGFLVEPGDAAGLALAFRAVAADPAAARALAARGRVLVEEEFALHGVVRRLARELDAHGAALGRDGADAQLGSMARLAARACGRETAERVGVARVERRDGFVVARLLVPRPGLPPLEVVAKRHVELPAPAPSARDRAAREQAALQALLAEGLSVPRPLGFDEQTATLIVERPHGSPAARVFRAARRDPGDALRVAGAVWFFLDQLRQAQGPPRDDDAFSRDAVLARLRRELREDAESCIARGLPERLVRGLRARCHRELPDAVPRDACWTHGNFWPGNVLVDRREGWEIARITVVDLESMQPGLPLEDAANFLEHVALSLPSLLSLSRLDRVREEIESVLLVGRGEEAVIPEPLRIAKALRLAARSPALVKGPRWRRTAIALRLVARLLEVRP